MFAHITLVALLAASLAYFFSGPDTTARDPYIQGRNKTVLFFANKEHGIANVLVASASALLENFPDIDVHYASFPGVGSRLEKTSLASQVKTPGAGSINFHELQGPSYTKAVTLTGKSMDNVIHPPGFAGIGQFVSDMQIWISPWSAEDHLGLYEELSAIIDEVDPAVIVLDTLFRPAIDITRGRNRQHVFVTPNTLVDNFLGDQPYGSMFWKYPA